MPASFVQANFLELAGGGVNAITSSALSITAGNYLFVYASKYTAAVNISAVVQTNGENTFVKAGSTQGGDANHTTETWYTPNPIIGTSSATFQVRFTGNTASRVIGVGEFNWPGVTSVSYEAESAHVLASGSARTSLTLDTTTADDLLFAGWIAFDIAQSLSSGTATIIGQEGPTSVDDAAIGYRIAASASAYTVSLIAPNVTNRYSVTCKAFRGVVAGGATAWFFTLPMLDVGR